MPVPSSSELLEGLAEYRRSLELKASSAPKTAGNLVELDDWYRVELPKIISERKDAKGRGAYLEKVELERLMDWKLAHGKWRPRLVQLVSSNPASLIKSTTLASLSPALPPNGALKELGTLKGVGPATASALLALLHPESQPFLSDEAVEAVGITKAEYTVKGWERFVMLMQERLKELRNEDNKGWEGKAMRELEMAMWSWAVKKKYGAGGKKGDAKVTLKRGTKRKEEEHSPPPPVATKLKRRR